MNTDEDVGQSSQIKLNQATSDAAHGSDVTAAGGAAAVRDIPYAEQYNEWLAKTLRPAVDLHQRNRERVGVR